MKVFEQDGRERKDRDVGWEELRGKIEVLLKRGEIRRKNLSPSLFTLLMADLEEEMMKAG